ncbi:hypothetical protein AND_006903 [Anopheles darlingi]|uniref:Uncharacterized protein n=1 Tax=Anopheles darlingi TaxID=43151 RepID=W5JDM9_ANODA|nr:hypothetical protein AND_006903 [Anopheles darlingi]
MEIQHDRNSSKADPTVKINGHAHSPVTASARKGPFPGKLILSRTPPEPGDTGSPGTPSILPSSNPLTNGVRSRGPRQVSWGPPPPPALISANPLPFKIDETPESPA